MKSNIAIACAALALTGSALAQSTYFFGANPDVGPYDGTFALPGDFLSQGVNHDPVNTLYTTNIIAGQGGVQETDFEGNTGKSLQFLLGDVQSLLPAGEVITSITMRLFLDGGDFTGAGGGNTTLPVSVLAGNYVLGDQLGALGNTEIGSFSMTGSDLNTWMEFTVPVSALSTGFALSVINTDVSGILAQASFGNFNMNDLANTPTNQLPGFTVTTTLIPEPSAAALGLLGTLGLFMRRRR